MAAARFETMRAQGEALMPGAGIAWTEGAKTFLHKGVNGRWQGVFSRSDLAAYEAKIAAEFTPALGAWLENGRLVAGDPALSPEQARACASNSLTFRRRRNRRPSDLAEITRRSRDQAADLTIHIASLLQGGVLSAAAFSLIAISQVHDHMAVRMILWLNFVIISITSFLQLCQRSILMVNAGPEVTLMLPVMALLQIIPFAILSSDALGPGGWRYWYIADLLVFCVGGIQGEWAQSASAETRTIQRGDRRGQGDVPPRCGQALPSRAMRRKIRTIGGQR